MDAVELIEALDRVSPVIPAGSPICRQTAHALVDFAADDALLALLYEASVHEPVHWRSLFEGTPWWPHWRAGPALIDLRQAPRFQQVLMARMAEASLGLLLETAWPADDLHRHLSRWLHKGLTGHEALLRIQDPRKFGPLLCAMKPPQRQALLHCANAWLWHDGHYWRQAGPATNETAADSPPALARSELDAVPRYWLAAEAQGYAAHYANALPEEEPPEHWVLNRLLEADRHGIHDSQHLERWLRLALRHGADFHRKAPFNTLLDNPQVILDHRLRAMEDIPETPHDQRHPA